MRAVREWPPYARKARGVVQGNDAAADRRDALRAGADGGRRGVGLGRFNVTVGAAGRTSTERELHKTEGTMLTPIGWVVCLIAGVVLLPLAIAVVLLMAGVYVVGGVDA